MCLCFITKLERICRCIFEDDLLQLHSVCLLWQGSCWKFQTCLSARQAGSPLKGDHNNTMHHLLTFMMQGSHLLTMFLLKRQSCPAWQKGSASCLPLSTLKARQLWWLLTLSEHRAQQLVWSPALGQQHHLQSLLAGSATHLPLSTQ